MKLPNMRLFKEVFIKAWTETLTFINKVCLLVTFLLIPVLLIYISYNLHCGNDVTALVHSIILVLIIHSNKQL